MSRSPQTLKRLLPSQQHFKAFTFSLYNTSTSFFYLLISPLPFLRRLFSKTLTFFSSSMEPFGFSSLSSPSSFWDDDLSAYDPPLNSPSPEPIFLVPFRWWSEANTAIYSGREIEGVLYNTTSCLRNKKLEKDDFLSEVESEILLEMRTAGQTGTGEEEGVSGSDSTGDLCLALISEWMFLRAFKWHNDRKDVGGFLAEGLEDLFSLQIRLSFMIKENSFYIRINQKDNEIRAFQRACDIFCIESGLLRIWDFSGQTSEFLMNERKLFSVPNQPGDDILLKLEVYGLSLIEARETKREKLMVEQSKNGEPSSNCSMNRVGDDVNSYSRVKQTSLVDAGYCNACTLGLTGLYNLGNTCFMNSALQCLVHTTEIVDYFLGDFHKDLNFENPLGMNGNLARAFGELLRKLWTPGATPLAPREFKSVIAGFAPQFSGYNQHDSQEFLSFLLDGLHEDLNRVKSKPYIEIKDEDGCSDEETADEHWKNHLARNDSIIVDLCQGQYRSRVVCPVCKKMSIKFDPFMYLSLPLPCTTTRTMTLTVVSTDGTTLPSPITITVPKFGNLKDLVEALSIACSLGHDETLLVAEVFDNQILRFLEDPSDTLELIRDDDQLVAYRLPKDAENFPLVVFTHQCEEEKSDSSALYSQKRFGIPLVSRLSSFSEGTDMRKEFLRLLHPFIIPVEDVPNANDGTPDANNEDLGIEDANLDQEENLDSEFESDPTNMLKDYEIHMEEPVPMLKCSNAENVLVSWPEKMLEDYNITLLNSLPEVCKPTFLLKKAQESVSLYNCLDAFLKEEPLGPDDMWYCPSCKSHQQASKKLDLWRLPEILVIHLKRFSYSRYFKNKLESFVDFPIDDFDLSRYMDRRGGSISHHYMLYAISNHYGGMGSGHYTAFVQHRGRWYDFDDSSVYPITEEQIKTSSAYVLFYRRIRDAVTV